jgi:hypothetical protein
MARTRTQDDVMREFKAAHPPLVGTPKEFKDLSGKYASGWLYAPGVMAAMTYDGVFEAKIFPNEHPGLADRLSRQVDPKLVHGSWRQEAWSMLPWN